jgi:hypothetical protein
MHAFYICLIEGRRGLKDVLLFSNKEKPIISSSHEELEKIIQNKYFKNFEDWNDNDFLIRCLSFIQRTPRIAKIQKSQSQVQMPISTQCNIFKIKLMKNLKHNQRGGAIKTIIFVVAALVLLKYLYQFDVIGDLSQGKFKYVLDKFYAFGQAG